MSDEPNPAILAALALTSPASIRVHQHPAAGGPGRVAGQVCVRVSLFREDFRCRGRAHE